MTSTFVPKVENNACQTPAGTVHVVQGGPVDWLVREARFCSFEADRLEKELAELKAVLGDLLQEKMPKLYLLQDFSGDVQGIYLTKARAEGARDSLNTAGWTIAECEPTL